MSHFTKLFDVIQDFKKDKWFCDVTFVVEDQKFPAHKVVLAAASQYFKLLFTTDLKEKLQNEIKIEQISSSAFSDCLDYIYYGKWHFKMIEIKDLLHAVSIFVLDDMKDICVQKLICSISIVQCLSFYRLSVLFDLKALEFETKTFINENAEKILTNERFIKDVDENTLEMILKSEDVCISNESILFDALVNWVAVDEEERKDRFCELLPFVRLPMIDNKHFTKFVLMNSHLQKDCDTCSSYLRRSNNHLIDREKHELTEQQLHNRYRIDVNNRTQVYVLVDGCSKLFKFENEELQVADVSMYQAPPNNIDTDCRSVAFDGKCSYIFGEHKSRKAFCFDPTLKDQTSMWEELSIMPNEHNDVNYRSRVVCYYNKMLVIGGWFENEAVNIVDCFDTVSRQWVKFPFLNIGRNNPCCITHGDKVYAIGGWDNNNLSSVEVFSSEYNEWQMLPNMNKARQSPAAEYYNGRLFVSGGYINKDKHETSAETFREGDSSWTLIANMNVGRAFHDIFVCNNELYVLGGMRTEGSSLLEKWNKEEKKWEESETIKSELDMCKVFKV